MEDLGWHQDDVAALQAALLLQTSLRQEALVKLHELQVAEQDRLQAAGEPQQAVAHLGVEKIGGEGGCNTCNGSAAAVAAAAGSSAAHAWSERLAASLLVYILRLAMNGWRECVEKARRCRALSSHFHHHREMQSKEMAFSLWHRFMQNRRQAYCKASRAVHHYMPRVEIRRARHAFVSLLHHAAVRKMRRRCCHTATRAACARRARVSLACAFEQWLLYSSAWRQDTLVSDGMRVMPDPSFSGNVWRYYGEREWIKSAVWYSSDPASVALRHPGFNGVSLSSSSASSPRATRRRLAAGLVNPPTRGKEGCLLAIESVSRRARGLVRGANAGGQESHTTVADGKGDGAAADMQHAASVAFEWYRAVGETADGPGVAACPIRDETPDFTGAIWRYVLGREWVQGRVWQHDADVACQGDEAGSMWRRTAGAEPDYLRLRKESAGAVEQAPTGQGGAASGGSGRGGLGGGRVEGGFGGGLGNGHDVRGARGQSHLTSSRKDPQLAPSLTSTAGTSLPIFVSAHPYWSGNLLAHVAEQGEEAGSSAAAPGTRQSSLSVRDSTRATLPLPPPPPPPPTCTPQTQHAPEDSNSSTQSPMSTGSWHSRGGAAQGDITVCEGPGTWAERGGPVDVGHAADVVAAFYRAEMSPVPLSSLSCSDEGNESGAKAEVAHPNDDTDWWRRGRDSPVYPAAAPGYVYHSSSPAVDALKRTAPADALTWRAAQRDEERQRRRRSSVPGLGREWIRSALWHSFDDTPSEGLEAFAAAGALHAAQEAAFTSGNLQLMARECRKDAEQLAAGEGAWPLEGKLAAATGVWHRDSESHLVAASACACGEDMNGSCDGRDGSDKVASGGGGGGGGLGGIGCILQPAAQHWAPSVSTCSSGSSSPPIRLSDPGRAGARGDAGCSFAARGASEGAVGEAALEEVFSARENTASPEKQQADAIFQDQEYPRPPPAFVDMVSDTLVELGTPRSSQTGVRREISELHLLSPSARSSPAPSDAGSRRGRRLRGRMAGLYAEGFGVRS